nr:nuclear transport factor 2 family protein [Fredinandcohnia onubensis]
MENQLKQHLKELEEMHINVEVRKNSEALEKLLADDFFEIGSSGYMFNKKECLESRIDLSVMSLHNYEIYPLAADVVLTTYFIVNETRKRNTLRSSIGSMLKEDGNCIFIKGQSHQ